MSIFVIGETVKQGRMYSDCRLRIMKITRNTKAGSRTIKVINLEPEVIGEVEIGSTQGTKTDQQQKVSSNAWHISLQLAMHHSFIERATFPPRNVSQITRRLRIPSSQRTLSRLGTKISVEVGEFRRIFKGCAHIHEGLKKKIKFDSKSQSNGLREEKRTTRREVEQGDILIPILFRKWENEVKTPAQKGRVEKGQRFTLPLDATWWWLIEQSTSSIAIMSRRSERIDILIFWRRIVYYSESPLQLHQSHMQPSSNPSQVRQIWTLSTEYWTLTISNP